MTTNPSTRSGQVSRINTKKKKLVTISVIHGKEEKSVRIRVIRGKEEV
jgi:hypothetical protein